MYCTYDNFRKLISEVAVEIEKNFEPYDDVKQLVATEKMVLATEKRLGIKLPESYKILVKEYSNGIVLFDTEVVLPLKDLKSPTGTTDKKIIKIKDTDKTIEINKLISFTLREFSDFSSSRWVFICDGEYENNEYKVGYITQGKGNIVHTLDGGFMEWLEVLWKGHEYEGYKTVFSILYPIRDDMEDLWNWEG